MVSLNDLLASGIGSMKGLDTSYNPEFILREVDLKDPSMYVDTELELDPDLPDDLKYVTRGKKIELTDPSVYTTVRVEPADIPEGAKLEERGSGINKRQVLVGADVKDNDPFGAFLGGFADLILQDVTDFDKRGNIRGEEHTKGLRQGSGYGKEWNQEKENKLVEEKRRADIASGDATLTKQEAIDSLPGRGVLDKYEMQKMQEQRKDQFDYFMDAYPQYAKMINDEIAKRRYEAEQMPSEVLGRINKSRDNYISALLGRSQAQANIANATAMGLGRYSGMRNVAG